MDDERFTGLGNEEEKVGCSYFHRINRELSTIEKYAQWADQAMGELQQLQMDIRFLKALCVCLQTWGYTTDKETMKRLRSMLRPLIVIWLDEHEALSTLSRLARTTNEEKRLAETLSIDIQDFHSAKFDLEVMIQQSKQHVESLCVNLMHSSMQCKPSTFKDVRFILGDLQKNLSDFSSIRAANDVPLKKQIDILKGKIVFLDESFKNVEFCPDDKKDFFQFMNFIGDFASDAVCLTCLYWAKDSNGEFAAEMNIALFDMSQKIMPSAYDITTLYIGFQKSFNWQQSDDSFLLGEVVESLVDLFFEHLATTPIDDFQILRDRIGILFAYLTDPPCVNAQKDDIIRSQIYALLREDGFLLLSFDEMKNDLADKKMLLRDCTTKIDIANDMIRQLNCGYSDYWIRLEVEKMERVYFVSVQRELTLIRKYARWAYPVWDQLYLYKMELRFLSLFVLCFTTWDDYDEEIKVRLNSMINSLQRIWGKIEEKGLLAHRFHEICTGSITDWHPLASELEGKIELSKLEIEAWRVNMFHWSFRCKPSTTYNMLKFLDSILDNLNCLVDYKAGEIVPFKKQIEILKEKLAFLKNFLKLTTNCTYSTVLGEFKIVVQVFANDAACLTYLYWTKDASDEITSETNSILSQMLLKIKPATTDIARLYFETLKAIYVQRSSDSLLFGQTALSFVDFFLEDLVAPLMDTFPYLRDDILFLLTFLNDPPNANAEELIRSQIDILFWEGVYCLLPFDDKGRDFSRKKVHLHEFSMKIETINMKVRQSCCEFPDSSVYNFPMIISPGLLDFLIQNLRNLKGRMIVDPKFVPFGNCTIMKIEEDLVSFRPFFDHIFNLQIEENETWLEVVYLLHLIEHVISSCISSRFVFDHPIWFHMAYLSYVLERIESVKTKLEKIKEKDHSACLHPSAGSISTPTKQERPSEISEIFVGFEDEVKKIIKELTRGSMPLDIVSIVGMGGLGKTTLAKKVYGSSLVQCHFDVFAFCFVSQDHTFRRLLVDIIGDIEGVVDKENTQLSEDDLAHRLWQCLSHRKYLIVLDDIWSVTAWNNVTRSLPDNKNGSRVIFTTRSRDVADKCKIDCIPHQLRFLSDIESWQLLEKKVFGDSIPPPYLHKVGKSIAKNCKGLPLAVSLIAGLLARTEKSLRRWSEVAEMVVPYLADEGCMNIFELSYRNLPEHLKPCLLYLGAFPEDRLVRVKHVILLWIAEGFIQESMTKGIEDVAKEYFHDLVGRSFIIVRGKNSNGEIDTFRVHDMIRDFCLRKCRDRNFFPLNHGSPSSNSSEPSIDNRNCVSMQKQIDTDNVAKSSLSYARSLLLFFEQPDNVIRNFPLRKFVLARVFHSDFELQEYDMEEIIYLVHLRHIDVRLRMKSIPLSILNLWNIGSFILTSLPSTRDIELPETFWRMKCLRHVQVKTCRLKFSDGYEHEAFLTLDKVVSFSKPILSAENDLERLLQRLPAVKKLSAILTYPFDNDEEALDIQRNLDSLNLTYMGQRSPWWIIFPSTLKKLTLVMFDLSWTAVSEIAELECLQVLKLQNCSFPEPNLDMEDVVFQSLIFFELQDQELVEWNALTESLPCLEQLVIKCAQLEELPPCFGEITTLERIVVRYSPALESSALRIQEEQMELGRQVDVSIYNTYDLYNSDSQL